MRRYGVVAFVLITTYDVECRPYIYIRQCSAQRRRVDGERGGGDGGSVDRYRGAYRCARIATVTRTRVQMQSTRVAVVQIGRPDPVSRKKACDVNAFRCDRRQTFWWPPTAAETTRPCKSTIRVSACERSRRFRGEEKKKYISYYSKQPY